ncbi:MAG: hypothetical protein ACPIOQ_08120 [Promethearchaeia archaeon]
MRARVGTVAIANLAATVMRYRASAPKFYACDFFFFVGEDGTMEGYAGDACRTVVAQVASLLGAQP